MFTGLIEKIGRVKNINLTSDGAKLEIFANFDNVKIGDSIAINGICLTVVDIKKDFLIFDCMKETLNLSNLKNLKTNDEVNLERAMKLNDRLDGHIVSGHIDCIAILENITQDGFSKRYRFICDSELIIKKGSIAINGVSLTVTKVYNNGFEVSLIPETIKRTNLKNLKNNDIVNIEYDILGKYIQKFLNKNKNQSKITMEFLKENGF